MFVNDDEREGEDVTFIGQAEGKKFNDGNWHTVRVLRKDRLVSTHTHMLTHARSHTHIQNRFRLQILYIIKKLFGFFSSKLLHLYI